MWAKGKVNKDLYVLVKRMTSSNGHRKQLSISLLDERQWANQFSILVPVT